MSRERHDERGVPPLLPRIAGEGRQLQAQLPAEGVARVSGGDSAPGERVVERSARDARALGTARRRIRGAGRRRLPGRAQKRRTSIRAKVEHPFLYVKRDFGYSKVRYRGLAKNTQRIAMLLGANTRISPQTARALTASRPM